MTLPFWVVSSDGIFQFLYIYLWYIRCGKLMLSIGYENLFSFFLSRIFGYCICTDLQNKVYICMAFFVWKYESHSQTSLLGDNKGWKLSENEKKLLTSASLSSTE